MPTIEQHSVANHLLAALPSADFARLAPTLEPVDFAIQQTLFPAEEEVKAAYFVEAGVITMLARLEDGSLAEVGLIGREGMAGLPQGRRMKSLWELIPLGDDMPQFKVGVPLGAGDAL